MQISKAWLMIQETEWDYAHEQLQGLVVSKDDGFHCWVLLREYAWKKIGGYSHTICQVCLIDF